MLDIVLKVKSMLVAYTLLKKPCHIYIILEYIYINFVLIYLTDVPKISFLYLEKSENLQS